MTLGWTYDYNNKWDYATARSLPQPLLAPGMWIMALYKAMPRQLSNT